MFRENRLIRRLQQRDESAFREMVRTHQQQVFNLIFRMLGNKEEAEDLAQDVFVTVFKSVSSFRGESKFSTWLYRIAINHCRNRHKYLSRRLIRPPHSLERYRGDSEGGNSDSTSNLPAPNSEPDKMLIGLQLEEAIQREIAALEEEQRLLIILRDIQGLSYQEISTITQLPEGTVKSRLHRARMTLKDHLQKFM